MRMAADDLTRYESAAELALYREYRDIMVGFTYIVTTERRQYLANQVDVQVRGADTGDIYFDVTMRDAWVWDLHASARFIKQARILTFRDVNVEELHKPDDL